MLGSDNVESAMIYHSGQSQWRGRDHMESMTFCEESVIGGAAKLLLAIVCGASLIYPFAIESTFSCGSSRGFGTTCRASCDVHMEMLDRCPRCLRSEPRTLSTYRLLW